MDRNNPEDQQKQKKSNVDRANDLINKGHSTYKRARDAKKLYKGLKAARAAGNTASAASSGVSGGVALFGSGAGEIIVAVLLFLLLVIVIVAIILVIIGSGATPPQCDGIDADSDKASTVNPVVVTVGGCPDNVTYSWKPPIKIGNYTDPVLGYVTPASGSASVLYYPESVANDTEVKLSVDVCWGYSSAACTTYELTVTVVSAECTSQGGNCIQTTICNSANDLQPIPGVCSTTNTTCCKAAAVTGDFRFFCQYGSVNSSGRLSSYGYWNYKQPSGKTCEINTSGCAPTSFAMVLSTLGYSTTPKVVSQKNPRLVISNENIGCRDSGFRPGTSWEDIFNSGGVRSWVRGLGYNMTGDLTGSDMSLSTLRTLKSYIDNGCYIVAGAYVRYAVGAGLKSEYGGHAFAISDVDVNNRSVTAYDPTFCRSPYIGGKRTFTNVTSISKSSSSSVNGWIFATAICR